jgi:hypothetical protein
MRKKTFLGILLFAALLFFQPSIARALRCDEKEPKFSRYELVWTLKKGGFSNALDAYVEFARLGNIKVDEKTCFTFYYYTREFPAASNVHYSTRLLVFKNWNYAGMYGTDGDTKLAVEGNAVVVSGDGGLAEKIVFDKDEPPSEIYVNGVSRTLFK